MKDKTEKEQVDHGKMLADAKNILESHNVPAILTGSALLGAYRDGDLVPWCMGAVISTFYKNIKRREDAIIKDFINSGYTIERHYKNDYNYKIRVSRGKYNIEILGYTKDKNHFYRKLKDKKKIVPKHFLKKPFGKIKLRGETYKTPQDVEGYLEFVYVDWKTPTRSKSPSTYKRKQHMVIDK